MAACLMGSGSIGQRMLLIRRSAYYARSNNRLFTSQVLPTRRSITASRQFSGQQCLYMSTIPSSSNSPFESIGTADSTTTASSPLSPNEQLLASIESLRPRKKIIDEKAFARLESQLRHSYTVPQIKAYFRHHNIPTSAGKRKADLIQHIMERFWQVTTMERKRTKEIFERKNTSQQQFNLESDELFFVLDNNGSMLKKIEDTHEGVRIMINMSDRVGTVEGPKRRLAPALAAIREALVLERQSFMLDHDAPSSVYLNKSSRSVINDLSRVSGAYISTKNGEISLTAPNKEALEDAKRKLDVFFTDFGLTSKPSLQSSDSTVIQNQPASTLTAAPLTFMPLHDLSAMPLSMKTVGWCRISSNENIKCQEDAQVSNLSQFHVLGGKSPTSSSTLSPSDLKDMLKQPLELKEEGSDKHISLEATFGHLLFQNPAIVPGQPNLLVPELRDSFNVTALQKLFDASTSHRRFLYGTPPKSIRPSLVPMDTEDGFHQRSVTINYIDSSLLGQLQNKTSPITATTAPTSSAEWAAPLRRLQLEFIEQDDGELKFKRAIGEHGRSTMDILGLAGNVDVRLIAKDYTSFDNTLLGSSPSLRKLASQCQLSSYLEVSCPSTWKSEANDMVLVDAAFNNESRYRLDDMLVTLRYVEEQERKTRRAEMKIEPDPSVTNGFDTWNDFWCKIVDLSKRWHYRIE